MSEPENPMDNEGLNGERRKFPRLKASISIVYQIDKHSSVHVLIEDKEVDATTLDLSQEGMAILTELDIPILALLAIEFMIYKTDEKNDFKFYKAIKVSGHVRSNVLLDNDTHRVGIHFSKISDEDKKEISDFIQYKIEP